MVIPALQDGIIKKNGGKKHIILIIDSYNGHRASPDFLKEISIHPSGIYSEIHYKCSSATRYSHKSCIQIDI